HRPCYFEMRARSPSRLHLGKHGIFSARAPRDAARGLGRRIPRRKSERIAVIDWLGNESDRYGDEGRGRRASTDRRIMDISSVSASLALQPTAQFVVARGPDLTFVYSKVDAQTQEVVWSWPNTPKPTPSFSDVGVGVITDISA